MNPDQILSVLPAGDKPVVAILDAAKVMLDHAVPGVSVAELKYTKDIFGARASLDDLALRERFVVRAVEQVDDGHRDGIGNLVRLDGFTVRYALAAKAPKAPK